MDQIKIGKFIATLRKEKGMTQSELATKIGVTDRAVSKWENGRGMPDISLIQSLCAELSISVNELLCGERISEEETKIKADENIVNSLKLNLKSIKYNRIISAFLILLISVFSIICSCYVVDIIRMRNDKPVIFSTWGFCYAPPIDLRDDLVELAVKKHIINNGDTDKKYESEKTFAAIKTYLIEEKDKGSYYLYTWVLCKKMYEDGDKLLESGSYSMPIRFYIEKQCDNYVVLKEEYARDGYYSEDMKNLFPQYIIDDMDKIYCNGDYERLELDIDQQIELYFRDYFSY